MRPLGDARAAALHAADHSRSGGHRRPADPDRGGAPSLASTEVYHVSKPKQQEVQEECSGERQEPQPTEQPPARAPIRDMAEGRMVCQAVLVDLPAPDKDSP